MKSSQLGGRAARACCCGAGSGFIEGPSGL